MRRKVFPETLVAAGLEIGQKRAPSAFAVVEMSRRENQASRSRASGETKWHYVARFLERLPPGTSYMQVARRLAAVCDGVRKRTQSEPTFFVDATGLGTPVIDLLREEVAKAGRLREVYFNHGDRRSEDGKGSVALGKAFLVSRLKTLLERNRIHLPGSPEARQLAEELLEYEVSTDEAANDRYGAFRVGRYDDLTTALGMAVQKEPNCNLYPGVAIYGL